LEKKTVNNYIREFKKLKKDEIESYNKIKIAVLSSFTTKGIMEILTVKCLEININAKIYECKYGQYMQEILKSDSELYKFSPDLIILFIDLQSLLGDMYFIPNGMDSNERKKMIDDKFNSVVNLLTIIKSKLNSKIILHNFEVPIYSPLGILDEKQDLGFIESIEELNKKLRNNYKKDSQVYVFNYDMFSSKLGKQNLLDNKMYYLADMKLKLNYIPNLCDEYIKYIKPILSMSKKCIVLDLDNTLWGGIIGESDVNSIKLGPTPEGRPFYEFQKYLSALNKRGVILAINSKNNYEDAMEVIENNPYMILKENDFASIKINWNNKVQNLREIAKEINIGLDSIVFIDDDRFNVEMIRNVLPEVKAICLPEDPALYVDTLKELDDFNILQLTDEDLKKKEQYYYQRKRNELKSQFLNIDDYLKALQMVVDIHINDYKNIARISQLTQKTNQFNLTTKRYFDEDIKNFMNDGKHMVLSFEVKDKFADNGIVGIAILNKEKDKWIIDTLLLSCRVIGRRIEDVMMDTIIKLAKEKHVKSIIGEFILSKKNKSVEDLYDKFNFVKVYESQNEKKWTYDHSKKFDVPNYIDIKFSEK
jgi:FkbH-like protein